MIAVKAASGKKPEPVSRLYAKALFELAQEKNELEAATQDLGGVVELLRESFMLRQTLESVIFSIEDREKIAAELGKKAGLNPLVQRFMLLLISKNRLPMIESIHASFRELMDESKNIARGTVTTVEPLNDAQKADLAAAFSKKFNKQVELDPLVDKEILGGLVVKVQGLTFDGSLRTTIRRLKENLERQSI